MPNDEYIKRSDAMRCKYTFKQGNGVEIEPIEAVPISYLQNIPAADVEPKQKWIPVTERLPEEKISPMTMDYTEYPCVFDGRDGQREVRYYKFGKGHFWHGPGCIDEYVTHWAEPMPLPEPPKEADA